ncbi:Wzz/FepE/Etk N-terminal domain-containing protein [Spirulina major]|uniref:Wzz/FepE/Etk N-terminal domain-containing protein n=1 Tax=Spirulina major TaxID=270636 RepID=UPI000933A276|nr:Wzz/FepE/Etk N-terminal domain-containing protein [Spirulina major]
MVMNPEQSPVYDDDEISLVDIIRFFQRRWRLIGVTTLVVAIAATATTALQATTTYQQTITLGVEPDPLDSLLTQLNPVETPRPAPKTLSQIGQWTVTAVGTVTPDAVSISAAPYDATSNTIALTLTAATAPPLEDQTEPLMAALAIAWQDPLNERITDELRTLAVQDAQVKQAIAKLDAAIAVTPPDNIARRTALETQRAELLRAEATLSFQQGYFQDIQDDLADNSVEFLPLTVIEESEISAVQRSPLQIVILSLIAGFMVATLAAILLEQWPRLQAELAAQQDEKPKAGGVRPE